MAEYEYFRPDDDERNVGNEHRRRIIFQITRRYELRDTTDPFAMSVDEFVKLYRMPQHIFIEFVELIRAHFYTARERGHRIPIHLKVLCAVGFYACGSYQRPLGRIEELSMCQSSVSRCISEVTEVLNRPDVLTYFVKFPFTHEEREVIIERNFRYFRNTLPRVLGFIDGTLVKIVPPPRAERQEIYRTRKGFTGLNVQIVCNSDLYIMDVKAQFPGSCNDPHIYRASGIRDVMTDAYRESRCWLLGDSIYPLQPWMHTPIENAGHGTPEYYYTKALCHCRSAVERCIGVLKARWRCLLCDRTLHYRPVKAGKIVNACVVLHNYLSRLRAPIPRPIFERMGHDAPDPADDDDDLLAQTERGFLWVTPIDRG